MGRQAVLLCTSAAQLLRLPLLTPLPPAHPTLPALRCSAGELPAGSTMVPVLARLLEFSPSELNRVQTKAAEQQQASTVSSFFKLPGM